MAPYLTLDSGEIVLWSLSEKFSLRGICNELFSEIERESGGERIKVKKKNRDRERETEREKKR